MKDLMDRTIDELKAKAADNGQHPRTLIVATAQAAIGAAIAQVEQKYDLTTYELVKCLAEYLSLSMKYALRVERHGDAEYPADAPLCRGNSGSGGHCDLRAGPHRGRAAH